MSKDYRGYSDSELEREYDRDSTNSDVWRELDNRGYEEVDGEMLDEYEYEEYLEEQKRVKSKGAKNNTSGGTFSGIGCLVFIVIIIGLFTNPRGTWEIIKTVFMLIAYGIVKFFEFIFQ